MFENLLIPRSARLKEILMKTSRLLIAIALCVLSTKMADASISFTTVVTPSGSQTNASAQSFSIKLGMIGSSSALDRVATFGFTARLSLGVGDLVASSGNTIFTPDVPNTINFFNEFKNSPQVDTIAGTGVTGFSGNEITFAGIDGNNVDFTTTNTERFRTINFTVQAGTAAQNITLSIITPTFTTTDNNAAPVANAATVNNLAAGSITAVPEPSSISLIVLGGVGGIYARWRTKKKKINTESQAQ